MPIPSPILSPSRLSARITSCLLALAGFAPLPQAWALDANVASQAQLESIRGIGPAIAARIVAERERGPYVDLEDLRDRVRGVGAASLRRMTEAGLEVMSPAGMEGGIAGSRQRGAGASGGRARAWVRELPTSADQPRRPSSPGSSGW